ncbi:MAG: hypothetical protein ACYC91_06375 [Solirubrobacteraceae bacterium]
MKERKSDTEATFGEAELPKDVSEQNREEPSTPHRGSGAQGHEGSGHSETKSDDAGASGEGSQSTGNPRSAG